MENFRTIRESKVLIGKHCFNNLQAPSLQRAVAGPVLGPSDKYLLDKSLSLHQVELWPGGKGADELVEGRLRHRCCQQRERYGHLQGRTFLSLSHCATFTADGALQGSTPMQFLDDMVQNCTQARLGQY